MLRSNRLPTCWGVEMRVLLVGFGPFPGAPFNPSAVLVKMLARRRRPAFADIDRTAHVFATTYASVDRELPKLLAEKPDIILMFGLAGRRRHLCIETQARNAVSVLHPDAGGYRPTRSVIAAGRPAALRGNLAFANLLGAVRASSFPARLSRDAGRYLCNYAYWQALARARSDRPLVQFVHIPPVIPGRPQFGRLIAASEALLIALMASIRR
jgi:pyroglutamyl-peptidase